MAGQRPLVVHVDSRLSDEERRERIYRGEAFLFSPRPTLLALTELARELIVEAFSPLDPREALECRRNDADAEMGLAALARARMPGMPCAFVLYRKGLRGEGPFELFAELFCDRS